MHRHTPLIWHCTKRPWNPERQCHRSIRSGTTTAAKLAQIQQHYSRKSRTSPHKEAGSPDSMHSKHGRQRHRDWIQQCSGLQVGSARATWQRMHVLSRRLLCFLHTRHNRRGLLGGFTFPGAASSFWRSSAKGHPNALWYVSATETSICQGHAICNKQNRSRAIKSEVAYAPRPT